MNDNAIILTLIFRKKAQKKQVNSNFENLDSSKSSTDPDPNTGKNRRSTIFRFSSEFWYSSCSREITLGGPLCQNS